MLFMLYNLKDYSVKWCDRYMAENVKWLSELMRQNSKVSIWAHNFHIGNYYYTFTGFHLDSLFGNSYHKIGFIFSTGSFSAHSGKGKRLIT